MSRNRRSWVPSRQSGEGRNRRSALQTGPANARRLRVEMLEDRRLLAVFLVSNLDDSGTGSLRDAIAMANMTAEADTIEFAVTGTINISSQLTSITQPLSIRGPGADLLTIDAGGGSRIFNVNDSDSANTIDVMIDGLSLTRGNAGNFDGGAIINYERLTVSNSSLFGNQADDAGAVSNLAGGQLHVIGSALYDNTADRWGGAILSNGAMVVRNSTISGNTALLGGGIYSQPASPGLTVENSTITDNTATLLGGGLRALGTVHAVGSIVAGNQAGTSSPDIQGSLDTDVNNLIGGDPLLGPLADNGGSTPTHALLPGSSAFDAGVASPLRHVYELNGSLTDSLGGPALVSNGGVVTPTGFDFEPDEGLNLPAADIDPAEYTIEIDFSFDAYDVSPVYQSIINFKDLDPTADDGLYAYNDTLVFYNSGRVAQSGSVFTANTLHKLVFTRDSATDEITASVDGVPVWSYIDSDQDAVFTGPNPSIHFFRDNSVEEEAGFVDRIRIYDAVVDPYDQRGEPFDRFVGAAADIGAYEAQIKATADFDGDLDVDGSDFLAWQRGFGAVDATVADGNSDDDDDVDASDLAAWMAIYGQNFNGPTGSAGGGQAHNNVQASLGLNYLIATQGLFPSQDFIPDGTLPYIGEVVLFAGSFEPAGWEYADGEVLPINGNEALFSILGTTYGGNGQTNFALPDLRGRAAMGQGFGPGLTGRTLGNPVGVETVTLTEANLPAHSHPALGGVVTTTQVGSGAAHANVQPSLPLNFMITSGGLFPIRDGSGPFHNGYIAAITMFAGNFTGGAPALNSQQLPIIQNPAMFSVLGTTYGGDGRINFAVPEMRGRIPIHEGNSFQLGSRLGSETATLSTNQLPAHTHALGNSVEQTGRIGGGQSHSNLQPYSTISYVINLSGPMPDENGSFGVNHLGAIVPFGGNYAPQDSAFLDGQLLLIEQHQDLFSLLSTTYGGDGVTTFALPDLRGRTPVGFGEGTGLTQRDLGEQFGENSTTLTLAEMPAHQHVINPPAVSLAAASRGTLIDAAMAVYELQSSDSSEKLQVFDEEPTQLTFATQELVFSIPLSPTASDAATEPSTTEPSTTEPSTTEPSTTEPDELDVDDFSSLSDQLPERAFS